MASLLARTRRYVAEDLWRAEGGARSLRDGARRGLQLVVMIAHGFERDRLLLRASALTYVTTLSLIPLLAVMVAFVGLIGERQALVDMVVDQLTAVSPAARQAILDRVAQTRLAGLGTLGATLLLFTSVLGLRHLEQTLNEIWGVRHSRTWMRRFADYLAVLVVAPILTAAALSLATTMQSEPLFRWLLAHPLFASLYRLGLVHVPTLFLLVAFSFLYWFFPNIRVRPRSALLAGALATVLFSCARHVYVDWTVGVARYNALFGGFAALPLVLTWLWVCWLILLLGAEVAFAHQNLAHYRRELRGDDASAAEGEAVGLQLAVEVTRTFTRNETPPAAGDLANLLDIPVRRVRASLDALERAGLLRRCEAEERVGGYLPARPPTDISSGAVLRALRGEWDAHSSAQAEDSQVAASVGALLRDLDDASSRIADARSLAELAAPPAERG